MRINDPNANLSPLLSDLGVTVNAQTALAITLTATAAIQPANRQAKCQELDGRLHQLGYDEFQVIFKPDGTFEIIDIETFNEAIDRWARNEGGRSNEAAAKIKVSFQSKSSSLILNLGLSSLPDEISYLTHVTQLDLSGNRFTSVPDSIRNMSEMKILRFNNNLIANAPDWINTLTQLTELSFEFNHLTNIPDLRNLTNLIEAIFTGNQITDIPVWIGDLRNLRNLHLSSNRIINLPSSIGDLSNLRILTLNFNMLSYIPDSIGNLSNLVVLCVDHNRLTNITPQVGRLQNLALFLFDTNPALADLPLSLGQCSRITVINIDGTNIPQTLADTILDMCAAQRRAEATLVLPRRLAAWQQVSRKTFDLAFIEEFPLPEKQIINEWLTRLERTKDFTTSCQRSIAEAACGMLQTLNTNPSFKEKFFIQVPLNNTNCGDRAGMAFNELYLDWKLATLDPKAPEKDKFELMMRAAKTTALRNALQKEISDKEAQNLRELRERRVRENNVEPIQDREWQMGESVQIFLYYETVLKEPLNLLTAISGMIYADIGRRNWIDQDELARDANAYYVSEMVNFTALIPIRDIDPAFQNAWAPIDEEFAEKAEKLEEQKTNLSQGAYTSRYNQLMRERDEAKRDETRYWLIPKLAELGLS
jgi:hypothetical protein